jgi:hypothetical protein
MLLTWAAPTQRLENVGKSQSVAIMLSLIWLTCAVAAASARRADSRMRRWRLRAAYPHVIRG